MMTPPPTRPAHAVEVGRAVYLRYPQPRDCEAFVALRRASRSHLEPWEPRAPAGFDAFGHDQFEWVYKSRKRPEQERMLIFVVGTRELVGQVSLGVITRGPLQSAYMGYWIGAHATGRGYMTEAVGLMLRHAFGRLGLHRVEANIQPHNEASKKVAARSGFRLEGYSPKYLQIAGAWADHERWAITGGGLSAGAWGGRGSAPGRGRDSRPARRGSAGAG